MGRSQLFYTKVPGGLATVEDMGLTTGTRFYVNSVTGTNGAGYGRHPDSPVASIDYAIDVSGILCPVVT